MTVFLTLSLLTLCYVIRVRPFVEKKDNIIEMVNESTVWIATNICFCFINPANKPYFIEVMGYVFVTVCAINIIFNLAIVVIDTIYVIKNSYQAYKAERE